MTIITSYPGVYIEELNRLSMSVSHSNTAVPAFAISKQTQKLLQMTVSVRRIENYMDYQSLLPSTNLELLTPFVFLEPDTESEKMSLADIGIISSQPFTVTSSSQGISFKGYKNNGEFVTQGDLTSSDFEVGDSSQDEEGNTIPGLEPECFTLTFKNVTESMQLVEHEVTFVQGETEVALTLKVADTYFNDYMRAYFNNGGGTCYLIEESALKQEVPNYDDITLLVAAGRDISDAASLLSEGNNLFAILDGPNTSLTIEDVPDWNKMGNSKYAAVYYPWLTANWNERAIAPSVAIAGAYCKNDSARGVWKAPANMTLVGVTPIHKVSDNLQGQYTKGAGLALNMIRQFNNGTPTIWGARTLDDSEQWRYVPVRRLFNSAEKDIQDAMKIAMFEPNSQPTWEAVRAAVTNYLTKLWKNGALQGTKPEEAFFVQVGKGITMDQEQINNGEMIVKVGMAAVRPAEFIVLQFTQDVDQ